MESRKEKIVYFVRHGHSVANAGNTFQEPSSPLSELGREQAEKIALRASRINFDALISSPYPRARDTAITIGSKTNKTPEFSDLFIERIKPTIISGKSSDDPRLHAIYLEWEESLYTNGSKIEDGENYEEIIKRADMALDFLEKRSEENILVVTHGFFMRTIFARLLLDESLNPENYRKILRRTWTENTGLSAIKHKWDKKDEVYRWRLWILNDHAHLG